MANEQGDPAVTLDDLGGIRFPDDEPQANAGADAKTGSDGQPVGAGQVKGEARGEGSEAGRQAGAEGAGAGDEEASYTKLTEFMAKKGIKDIDGLLNLATNLEKKNTLLQQDVQRLGAASSFRRPAPSQPREVRPVPIPENPLELMASPEKFGQFISEVDRHNRESTQQEIENAEYAKAYYEAAAQIEAFRTQNPREWRALQPYMREIAADYPNASLGQLIAGARNLRAEDQGELVGQIKTALGLSGPDTERVKAVFSRLRQAPVGGGTGTRTAPGGGDQPAEDKALFQAIMDADKF